MRIEFKLILEPIFEADFQPGSYGDRPNRSAHDAVERVADAIVKYKTRVLKLIVKTTGAKGVAQGDGLAPLLSNRYLTEVDRMLERAKQGTRRGRYTSLAYCRFADDLVILVDAYPQHDWLRRAVETRLREAVARLHVPMNEAKSRRVDLAKGESFGFLGCAFRRVRSRMGKWRAYYPPLLQKRTALLRKLKAIFRRYQAPPLDRVVYLLNPILRGWVPSFAIGAASRCFGYGRDWVEKKVRRHLMRARKRRGFGWKRWSKRWLYDRVGLFNHYRVHRRQQLRLKVLPD